MGRITTRSAGLPRSSLVVAVLVASIAAFLGHDSATATSFNPTSSVSLANSAPGANSDFTVNFGIGLGPNGKYGGDPGVPNDDTPDAMFSAVLAFTPAEFATADPASVPIGALAAKLTSTATLGLVNNACSTPLPVSFDMIAASTDINDILPNAYGINAGRNPGAADDQFDAVDGLPLGVKKYPDYLARILVDSNGTTLKPRARLYGQTLVSGTDVSLNFAQFDPGTNIKDTQLDPALGVPSVTVLQNVTDPAALMSPNPITDF